MKWFKKQEKQQKKQQLQISLEAQRAEKLMEMGAQLRTCREEKGLSLDEVVAMTRISRRLLQAIEQANLAELPEPIYTQGLIREFANVLGFNGAEFASTYPLGSSKITINSPWIVSPIGQLSSVHLYIIYIFLIFISVSALSNLLGNASLSANSSIKDSQVQSQGSVNSQVSSQVSSQVKSQINSTKNSSKSKVATPKNNQASSEQVQIGITLKEKSWIRVTADGKVKYEGNLAKGTQRSWKADKELTVRAGNAGGVLVRVNDQAAKQMGKSGVPKEVKVASSAR